MFGRRRTSVLGLHRYAISGAVPGTTWTVDLAKSPPYCDCPAFLHHRYPQICKHVIFFTLFEGGLLDADS